MHFVKSSILKSTDGVHSSEHNYTPKDEQLEGIFSLQNRDSFASEEIVRKKKLYSAEIQQRSGRPVSSLPRFDPSAKRFGPVAHETTPIPYRHCDDEETPEYAPQPLTCDEVEFFKEHQNLSRRKDIQNELDLKEFRRCRQAVKSKSDESFTERLATYHENSILGKSTIAKKLSSGPGVIVKKRKTRTPVCVTDALYFTRKRPQTTPALTNTNSINPVDFTESREIEAAPDFHIRTKEQVFRFCQNTDTQKYLNPKTAQLNDHSFSRAHGNLHCEIKQSVVSTLTSTQGKPSKESLGSELSTIPSVFRAHGNMSSKDLHENRESNLSKSNDLDAKEHDSYCNLSNDLNPEHQEKGPSTEQTENGFLDGYDSAETDP